MPAIVELVPDERRDLLAMIFGPEEVNRAMVGPAGMPPEIAEAVQEAYRQMSQDPEFIADLEKAGFVSGYTSPAQIAESLNKLFGNQEMRESLKQISGR